MASVDRPGSGSGSEPIDGGPGDVPIEGDPAADAARVIKDEALSIMLAVDARTSEIVADARRRADDIRRGADESTAAALARLRPMARELEALATQLDDAAAKRAARLGHGG